MFFLSSRCLPLMVVFITLSPSLSFAQNWGGDDGGYNSQGGGNNNDNAGYNSQGGGNNNDNAGYNSQGGGNNNDNAGYNSQGGGNNNDNAGYNSQGGGNNGNSGYNSQGDNNAQAGYGNSPMGYGNAEEGMEGRACGVGDLRPNSRGCHYGCNRFTCDKPQVFSECALRCEEGQVYHCAEAFESAARKHGFSSIDEYCGENCRRGENCIECGFCDVPWVRSFQGGSGGGWLHNSFGGGGYGGGSGSGWGSRLSNWASSFSGGGNGDGNGGGMMSNIGNMFGGGGGGNW